MSCRAGVIAAAVLSVFAGVAAPANAATENVVYSFKGGSDGANPQAGLINVNGTIYGTTMNGGTSGMGTVFSITP